MRQSIDLRSAGVHLTTRRRCPADPAPHGGNRPPDIGLTERPHPRPESPLGRWVVRSQFRRHQSRRAVPRVTALPRSGTALLDTLEVDPMRIVRADAAEVAARLGLFGGGAVLVTDADGPLGAYVVAVLEALGVRVVTAAHHGGALLLPSDEIGHVVHLGPLSGRDAFGRDPAGTLGASMTVLGQLLDHARAHGAHLTFVSAADGGQRLDLANPSTFYPAAERVAEAMCASYRDQYGVASSIVRLAHVYGPAFDVDVDGAGAWIEFVRNAVAGETVVVRTTDSRRLPWTYVADAAEAVLRTALTGADRQATVAFQAVDDRFRSDIRAFARAALRSSGRPPAIVNRITGSDRAVTEEGLSLEYGNPPRPPGWRPHTDLDDGIGRTVRWYEDALAAAQADLESVTGTEG
ncbi:MAG: NAD(P)-dependent oxidoreductase [Jatrophihabitans sp.]|nr:MAG: NAD(P)-dependent oxidoreductase [Jatrophihabitans sp.]